MPRLSFSKRAAIRQAVEMQRLCFSGAQLLDQDMRQTEDKELRARIAAALGNLSRNWTALQDSVRVLKGDPMPGSFRPKEPQPKRQPCRFAPLPTAEALPDNAPLPTRDAGSREAREWEMREIRPGVFEQVTTKKPV